MLELVLYLVYVFVCFIGEIESNCFLWLQKKLGPSVFKIACAQAAKNKWVEMGKQLISRKVC